MYFITNRAFQEGLTTVLNRSVQFDLNNNLPYPSVYFCKRNPDDSMIEIGSTAFFESLSTTPHKQILLYIHGFNTMPDQAFLKAHQIQKLLNSLEDNFALVVPLIWPCDNDFGIVKDYWDDQRAADSSGMGVGRALEKFLAWIQHRSINTVCDKFINILAHSMGNRVLKNALNCLKAYSPQGIPMLFRNTFMFAADLENEALERVENALSICHASRNVCVYYANDDLALNASKVGNVVHAIFSKRLGNSGPENWEKTPLNVYGFDCDSFNNVYDHPTGHTYYLHSQESENKPGIALQHVLQTLKTGRPFPENFAQRSLILR